LPSAPSNFPLPNARQTALCDRRQQPSGSIASQTSCGSTGHEQLDSVGLVPTSITHSTTTIGFSHDPEHQRFQQTAGAAPRSIWATPRSSRVAAAPCAIPAATDLEGCNQHAAVDS